MTRQTEFTLDMTTVATLMDQASAGYAEGTLTLLNTFAPADEQVLALGVSMPAFVDLGACVSAHVSAVEAAITQSAMLPALMLAGVLAGEVYADYRQRHDMPVETFRKLWPIAFNTLLVQGVGATTVDSGEDADAVSPS